MKKFALFVFMMLLPFVLVVQSYGYKYVVNKLNKPIWVQLNATGITESAGPIRPNLGHLFKFPGTDCLTKVKFKYNKDDEYKKIGRKSQKEFVEDFCKDRSIFIADFVDGGIAFNLYSFPTFKIVRPQAVDLKGLTPQEVIGKITDSKMFSSHKNVFFNANEPKSMQLGTLHLNVPEACEYNLNKLLLKANESPIVAAKQLKEPSFFKLMHKNTLEAIKKGNYASLQN